VTLTAPLVPRCAAAAAVSAPVRTVPLAAAVGRRAPVSPASPAAAAALVRDISTKRRRAKKMNKHKYEKMKKRMRNLTAKNVRT
jgi:hypothetical protein